MQRNTKSTPEARVRHLNGLTKYPYHYLVTLKLWHRTEHERVERVAGSLFATKEPSETTIRRHVHRAYRESCLPIRILRVAAPYLNTK